MPFDTILSRIVESNQGEKIFKALCEIYYEKPDADLEVKEYKKSSGEKKRQLMHQVAQKCVDGVKKYSDFSWEEVIMQVTHDAGIPEKWMHIIFGGVSDEEEAYSTFEKYLRKEYNGWKIIDTSHTKGRVARYADFTAIKKGTFSTQIISFDVKANPSAFDYFLNQADDFSKFSDQVYCVATPELVLEVGIKKRGSAARAEKEFRKALEKVKVGLMVIDMTDKRIYKVSEAPDQSTKKDSKEKALKELASRTESS